MHTTILRKVGGSVMLAVPPAVLEMLNLASGSIVGLSIEAGRIVVDPHPLPRYTLDDLLAASEYGDAPTDEDRAWIDAPRAGRELL